MLWSDVLPRLRSRAQTLELAIQLVDVQNLGAMPAVEGQLDGNNHLSHLSIITDCHRVSCGPFFLVSCFRRIRRDAAAAACQ